MASGFGLNGGRFWSDLVSCVAVAQLTHFSDGGYDYELILPDTGPSRCFAFWQELLGCYVVNGSEGVEGKKKCLFALEDYNECLHHSKEVRCLRTVEHFGRSTIGNFAIII